MAERIDGPNFTINWKGVDVLQKSRRAAATGINQSLAECVSGAKARVHVITSVLQGGIQVLEFAAPGDVIFGRWGTAGIGYAIWEEIGTAHRPGHPYLRPTMDSVYPLLAGKIKAAMR